jgi:hypothetical protein
VEGVKQLARFAACVFLIGTVVLLEGQAPKDFETVGNLCGKLVHLDKREKVPRGGTLEHTSPLPNVAIKLYPRDKTPCWKTLKPKEEVATGSDGAFTFAHAKPGRYWLVPKVGNREFKLALRLVRPDGTNTACRLQEFEIEDSGKFRTLRMVGYL